MRTSRSLLLSEALEQDDKSPEVRQIIQRARNVIAEAEQSMGKG